MTDETKNYVLVDKYDPRRALVRMGADRTHDDWSSRRPAKLYTEAEARAIAATVYGHDGDVWAVHVDALAALTLLAMSGDCT